MRRDLNAAEKVPDGLIIEDPYHLLPRRKFFTWLGLGWLAFASVIGLCLVMFQRFLFPNVLLEPPQQFTIGFPADFSEGVDSRFKQKYGIWVVKGFDSATNRRGIYVLIAICTHLGCTPDWLELEAKFKCPCHGSGYYRSGINFEGPAPRPLERARVTLVDDGQILVDKLQIFKFEKGEWMKSGAFLKV